MLTRSTIFHLVDIAKRSAIGDLLQATTMIRAEDAFELIRLIAQKIETEYSGLPGQPETMTVMDWLMPSYPLVDALDIETPGAVHFADHGNLDTATIESDAQTAQRLSHVNPDHKHFFDGGICGICLKSEDEVMKC
jgi:hypothetical protein